MLTIKSMYNLRNVNPPIEFSKVTRIERAPDNHKNQNISILYFYGAQADGFDKIVRTWFYKSESDRETELRRLREQYSSLFLS
ncbi:hypothetical protein [Persicitalea jodogahamensis]|uniref:Uncharacterized protein n=1 Tax=Persicitalea jodogahamensis TaxID=402147 RepID=A0A8J3G7D3_9BACT|nr:hypothetical protein [Persicitalea jodogahamensis]GHB54982.1 hypothetical protein GCM10007390_05140 [Persicitalea jodogahamensis]